MRPTFSTIYLDSKDSFCTFQLQSHLEELFNNYSSYKNIVIMCIGSDRSTGDSLGPLIGYKLQKYSLKHVNIYGTLDNPIHAGNINEKISEIRRLHPNAFILAIDASLGQKEHLGFVTLSNCPLRPGLGVKKELPSVGHAHITGIVNLSGGMDSLLLQTTKLSNVMKLADTISKALLYSLYSLS